MKLNVGCGNTIRDEYLNIDIIDLINPPPNYIKMNCFDIDRKFPINTFDEVYSEYFMEHLSTLEIRLFLYKVYKVLKPKGLYRFIVPSITNIIHYFNSSDVLTKPNGIDLFNLEVFGAGEIGRETPHKSLWTKDIAKIYLEEEGLFEILNINENEIDSRNVSMFITAERKGE